VPAIAAGAGRQRCDSDEIARLDVGQRCLGHRGHGPAGRERDGDVFAFSRLDLEGVGGEGNHGSAHAQAGGIRREGGCSAEQCGGDGETGESDRTGVGHLGTPVAMWVWLWNGNVVEKVVG
jgi:hypothetical protein